MLLLDLDMRFIAWSPSSMRNIGRPDDEIVGRPIGDIVPGAERGMREIIDALEAGEAQHRVIRRALMPNGERRWYETQGSYWRDDAGEVAGYLLVNREVTAEREAEAARREMDILLEAVIDNIPGTLTVQDLETERFLLVNAKIAVALGSTPDELVNRSLPEVAAPEQAANVAQRIAELRRSGGVNVSEHTLTAGPLAGRTLRMKRLLFDDGGGRERVLSIGEDITDLREASRALEAAVAEAEAANAAKSQFLANISHEIRTPLNGVLGMAQAMACDPLPTRQRERLDVVRQSSETLLSLLNDLLDIAKIEAGKVDLETVRFDLTDLVRSACAPFEALAEQKGVAVDLRLPATPDHRLGDPTRLRQVLVNLVSNAVKFTERGGVEIVVTQVSDQVGFTVADTGLGMAPETIAAMFEKFAQADVSTTRRFGGTGLGLAICRDLVELMGGQIQVRSQVGEGSRFSFTIPLPPAAPAAEPAPAPAASTRDHLPALRLLAAEDNKVNQLVLKTLLEQFGLDLTLVDDGAQALAAWEHESWDAILMDVQMPVMDGPAATAAIRAREAAEGRPRTPIIALTANAMAHHAAEYLAGGVDAVVSKPIRIQALLDALEALLSEPEAHQQDAQPSARAA